MRRSLLLLGALVCLGAFGCDGVVVVACGDDVVDVMETCEAGELGDETCESQGFALGGTLACNATCDGFDTSGCNTPLCGNGALDSGEACDGAELDGEDCVSQGFDSGTLACNATCELDFSECFRLLCNNGVIDTGEDCDGADLDGEDCVTQGFDIGTLACYSTGCTFDTTGCANTVCGDDFTEGSEQCDGADLTGLGCTDLGFDSGDLTCASDCTFELSACVGGCGNGVIEGGEVCDVTELRGRSCPSFGFDAGELACSTDCTTVDSTGCFASMCGDTVAEGAEECDGSDLRGELCMSVGPFDGGSLTCDSCALTTLGCTFVDLPGEDCGSAGVIDPSALPITLSASTWWASDDYGTSAGDCLGMGAEGTGQRDVVYSFTPTLTGTYTFTYTPSFDGAIYIVTDCADIAGTCLGGSEARNVGFDEVVTIDATSGVTYFVVLDGGFTGARGDFTLHVSAACVTADCTGRSCGDNGCGGSCGICPAARSCDDAAGACLDPAILPGNTCTVPFVVPGVPYRDANDSRFFENNLNTEVGECPGVGRLGAASSDVVYEFTPSTTGVYTIDVAPDGWDVALFVTTTCGDFVGSCLQGARRGGFGVTERISISMTASTTYYVHVDGAYNGSNQNGLYELTISDACVPDCAGRDCGRDGCGGVCADCADPLVCDVATSLCEDQSVVPGNTCGLAIAIGAAPFTVSGDTSVLTDDFSFAIGDCPGSPNAEGAGSGDQVYAFTPPSDGDYTFRLFSEGWDAGIFLVGDCTDTASTCLAGQEINTSPLSISSPLVGGTTYYIIADGGSPGHEGEFVLDICMPSCTGRVCGDDGCGGSCGSCPAGDSCGPVGAACVAVPGETCTDPFVIGTIPYSDSNNTRRFTDEYDVGGLDCPGFTRIAGRASSDVVYAFTPPTTRDYIFEVTSTGFAAGVFVTTTCSDFSGSCLGGASTLASGMGTLAVALEAAMTYYVHIDGLANSWNEAGAYILNVREPVCGDGTLEGLEECDDSNTSPGDGCDAGCLLEAFDCSGATLVPITSTDVPVGIPTVGTYTSTLVVPTVSTILRARVTIGDITHTWDDDLDIYLISPTGTRIELSTTNGGAGENYIGTVFDDGCGSVDGLITAGAAPFTGCYRPEGLLLDLVGEASNGTWTLEVSDTAGGDVGTLNAWSLDLCVP